MTAKPEFNYVTFIDAPPEKVWAALTQPEFTEQFWFKSRCTGDWSEGSDYTFTVADDEGGNGWFQQAKLLKMTFPTSLFTSLPAPISKRFVKRILWFSICWRNLMATPN